MGWFSNKKDKTVGTPDARKERKEALAALNKNYEEELKQARARGKEYIEEETPEYTRLNRAANDADAKVPFWGRW